MNTIIKDTVGFIQFIFCKKFAHMTLLGFSAGLPYYLIFSSLSLWLDQIGIAKSSITMFSWAALGYSFKFLWSPLVDKIPILFLTNTFGQRRGWLVFTQLIVIASILWMASINPADGEIQLKMMAYAAVLLGFSAATQDILIDAWRIEASNEKDIAILSSLYIVGFRVGMITSGGGALFLAHHFGTSISNYNYSAWKLSYSIMAAFMLIGLLTTMFIKEPKKHVNKFEYTKRDYLLVFAVFIIASISFILVYQNTGYLKSILIDMLNIVLKNNTLSIFISSLIQLLFAFSISFTFGSLIYRMKSTNKEMIRSIYIEPVMDLFKRHKNHAWLLIGIISTYRISDIVMGVSANLFYQHMGFDLKEIAGIVKTFGLIMTLFGGLLGGFFVIRFGVMKIMIVGAILSAVTNILFLIMSEAGKSTEFLIILISADNLSAGLAMAAFIGFLSLLVNKAFTAVQYAMFSSVMTLFPKILGGFSGSFIENWGFSVFFLLTTLIGIPVVLVLLYCQKYNVFDVSIND